LLAGLSTVGPAPCQSVRWKITKEEARRYVEYGMEQWFPHFQNVAAFPQMAVEGAYLTLMHNWANPQATKKSYELFARHVMPHFQGQKHSTVQAANRARDTRPKLAEQQMQAVEEATARYEAEQSEDVDVRETPIGT